MGRDFLHAHQTASNAFVVQSNSVCENQKFTNISNWTAQNRQILEEELSQSSSNVIGL